MIISRRRRYYQTRRESIDWVIAALFGVLIVAVLGFAIIIITEAVYGWP
jgi:preprotein translocase subunit Sss1